MVVGMSFPLAGAIGNWQNRQLAARTFLPTGGGGGGGGGARSQVGGGGAFLLWHRSDTATNTEVCLPHGKHYKSAKLPWSYWSMVMVIGKRWPFLLSHCTPSSDTNTKVHHNG